MTEKRNPFEVNRRSLVMPGELGSRPKHMAAPPRSPEVDAFLDRAPRWQGEMRRLRTILRDAGLQEGIKWGKPCFSFEGKNVAILQPFKDHCALMFFKGALLRDERGLLRSQGEHTQSALRMEFTSEAQIKKSVLQSYVADAVQVEKSGRKVEFRAKHELELPEELTKILRKDRKLAKAFAALTPGRRRGWVLHFSSAKQSQTRSARIEKSIPKILAGKGFNEA